MPVLKRLISIGKERYYLSTGRIKEVIGIIGVFLMCTKGNQNLLGKVGDRVITRKYFNNFYLNRMKDLYGPEFLLYIKRSDTLFKKRETFQQIIDNFLLEEIAKEEKIKIPEEAVRKLMKNYIPTGLTKWKEMQTPEGEFNYARYSYILEHPDKFPLIRYYMYLTKMSLIELQLKNAITLCYRVTSLERKEIQKRIEKKIKAECVFLPPFYPQVDTQITKKELEKKYKEIKQRIKPKKRVYLLTIYFRFLPSKRDTIMAERFIKNIYMRVKGGEKFENLVKRYSDDSLREFWIKKKSKIFKKIYKSQDIFTKPFRRGSFWVIYKILKKEEDSILVSPFIYEIKPSLQTELKRLKDVERFIKEIKKGKDIYEISKKFSVTPRKGLVVIEGEEVFFPGMPYKDFIYTFAMEAKKNNMISAPIRVGWGFYVFYVEKIETSVKKQTIIKWAKDSIFSARRYKELAKKIDSLKKLTVRWGINAIKGINFSTDTLYFLSFESTVRWYTAKFAGMVYNGEKGIWYGFPDNYLLFKIIEINEIPQDPFVAQSLIRRRLTKIYDALYKYLLKKRERFKDYRNIYNFYF